MVKLNPKEAQTLIESYLVSQYRPFAINDIVQNLHGQVTKTAATKALETLVQEKRVTAKTFGKVIIYCCNEKELEVPEGMESDKFTLTQLGQLKEELRELEVDKNAALDMLHKVLKEPSNDQLIELQRIQEEETAGLVEILNKLQKEWDPKMEPVIKGLVETEGKLDKEIRVRTKIMKNLLAIIKDTMKPNDMGEFLEEIGFEQVI